MQPEIRAARSQNPVMDRWISDAPRWLTLAALVYAPWAYGSTHPWTITGLNWLLSGVVALWFLNHLLRQRLPRIQPVMAAAIGGLVLQAWFMVLNAKYEYDSASHEFIALTPLLPWAPGSLNRALSIESATCLSLLLFTGFVVFEMAGQSIWRRRLLGTMAVTGTSIVLLGLAQRFTGATGIFWQQEDLGPNFFATYRNHTNAGAFINLIWPITIAFAVRERLRATSFRKTILWSLASVVCITGVMVNTSRAATAIAVILVSLTGIWIAWQATQGRFGNAIPSTMVAIGALIVLLIGAFAFMSGLDSNAQRWKQFDKQLTEENSRLLAARVCLKMIPEASWWGFGPGTFQTAFPYFSAGFGKQLNGRWLFAHQDYLQTLIESGYVGFAGWAALIGGAIIYSWRQRFLNGKGLAGSARTTHFGLLIALTGVLTHALVDFPFQIASIQLYTLTVVSILWSSKHWMREPKRMPLRRKATLPADALACAP